MKKKIIIGYVLFVSIIVIIALTLIVGLWFIRSNTYELDPGLKLEIWGAVSDGMHNSNTYMTHFNNYFYLVHASSPPIKSQNIFTTLFK